MEMDKFSKARTRIYPPKGDIKNGMSIKCMTLCMYAICKTSRNAGSEIYEIHIFELQKKT